MTAIHLFTPTFEIEECLDEIRQCLAQGWTGLGYKTVEFEAAWRGYTGLPHAHFLNSATAGLHLAVNILKSDGGWAEGDEVVTTPLTFVSTNHAILYEGLKPVFADVDDHLCLDPRSIEARLTPRTRAVMFVGFGGDVGQWKAVVDLCRARGLKLILDAAHQSGSTFEGRTPAADADVAIFSFQAVKNLPTADSGMVCFADAAHDATARRLAWLGIDKDTYQRTHSDSRYKWRYSVEEVGFKYHGNSIMAAIALVQLRHLERDNAQRRRLAARYDRAFEGEAGVRRIPAAPGGRTSRHLYQIRVARRDELVLHLNAQGVFPGVHYLANTSFPAYAAADGARDCPRADQAAAELISLPLHLRLSEADVDRVAQAVIGFVGAGGAGGPPRPAVVALPA